MNYGDLKEVVGDLHTGATVSDSIDTITKLVLGKIARRKLKVRLKTGEITPGSATEFNLKTLFPSFFALKPDAENRNRCIYYFQSTIPHYLRLTNKTRFEQATEGGFATLTGRTLKIKFPVGFATPDTLFVSYYSMYLVKSSDGVEKEKPDDDEDEFLIDPVFDDALVEGVLLYLKRRELNDSEFFKASREWEKSLDSLIFYQ